MEVHIVVKGDTLWKIARQYGVPFEELKRINAHLANPDYIVPGMKIFLPAGTLAHGKKGASMPSKTPVKAKEMEIPTAPKKEQKAPVTPAPTPATPPAVTAPVSPQSYPMPTVLSPIISFPCGWMPIYDADCYPCMPTAPMQMPTQQESPQWMPAPIPTVPPTLPSMVEEEEESPILPPPTEVVPSQPLPDESPDLPVYQAPVGEMPYPAAAYPSYYPMPIQYPAYFIHWGCHCHGGAPMGTPMGVPMYTGQDAFGYPQMPMMATPEQRLDWNVPNS